MGGSVGITIRQEDDVEHRMCRWTNSIPDFINHIKLIKKDESHLNDYLSLWFQMLEEYTSGEYKKKEHTMSDVYAPYPFLAPMDYGLVVVDYKTSTILHMQNYTALGSILPCDIDFELTSKSELQDYKVLFDERRFLKVRCYDPTEGVDDPFPIIELDEKMSFEEFVTNCMDNDKIPKWRFIEVDLSPWTITRFEKNLEGLKELKKSIIKLGFTFSEEEENMWKEYMLGFKKS